MNKIKLIAILLLYCVGLSAQINTNEAVYKVKSGKITVSLNKQCNLVGLFVHNSGAYSIPSIKSWDQHESK
jgi:hypothetical protein